MADGGPAGPGAAAGSNAVREWAAARVALSLEARDLTFLLATAEPDRQRGDVSDRVSRFVARATAFVERYDADGSLRAIFEAGDGAAYLGSRIPRAPDSFDHASTQDVAIHRWLVEHAPRPRD
jgi:hypothetical protein